MRQNRCFSFAPTGLVQGSGVLRSLVVSVLLLSVGPFAHAQDWPDEPDYPEMTKAEIRAYAQDRYGPLDDRERAALRWVFKLQPSALPVQEQVDELMWFANAARPLRGTSVSSVAENIQTHRWESDVLAQAFWEIARIKVSHNIIGEGSLVETLRLQIDTDVKVHDIYVNDADLIGTHIRLESLVNLTDYMQGDGREVTNPRLDLDDFLNPEFGQNDDGDQIQLPDQQFANLYWFRYDWFNDPALQQRFRSRYGYDLGVPRNWAAYEDIADFFTNHVSPADVGIEAENVYGHMDYGAESPSLGWRFTDAWLSIAGVGDPGVPNGTPVDEWGIRVRNQRPVGASVARGGATNGPAAYYALDTYIHWLNRYAPPEAKAMTWSEAGAVPAQGHIAQRVFQYITFLSEPAFTSPESAVTDDEGAPLWRMAPTPHGRYWEDGMKVGYQDAGSWSLPRTTTGDQRKAAWLWAQFCVSKSVSLKKFNVGHTPVRKSTVFSDYWRKHEGKLGGLITFYTSPVRNLWTDTGTNVPNYPALSKQWWKNIARAVTGEVTVEEAMNALARSQDDIMRRLEMPRNAPELNPERSRTYWLQQPGAPKAERPPEEPITVPYDELIRQWKASRPSQKER